MDWTRRDDFCDAIRNVNNTLSTIGAIINTFFGRRYDSMYMIIIYYIISCVVRVGNQKRAVEL